MPDMFMFVCVVLGLMVGYLFLKKNPKKGNPIPGPGGWPLVGYGFNIKAETAHLTYSELAERYGGITMVKVFGTPILVLNSADMVRSMFCDDPCKKYAHDRLEFFYGKYGLYGCKSILTTTEAYNSPHKELRRAFIRGMHVYGEGIAAFEALVHRELTRLNERLAGFEGQEFDMLEQIQISLGNILAMFLDGRGFDDDDPDKNIFWVYTAAATLLLMPVNDMLLKTFPWLRLIPGYHRTHFDVMIQTREKFIRRFFHDAKRSYKPGTTRGLVDFYLSEQRLAEAEGRNDVFTDEHICALIVETVGAGIATSTATIASTFLCLLNYPEYQTRIQEELDRVIGEERLPSVSDRRNCVLTEAVALEVQRYITTVPLGIPHFCKPSMEFRGYDIPENSVIVVNAWQVHHDEKIWGDPWTFRPERWIGEKGELLPNDHTLRKNWLAFGTGRRQCVGEGFARSRIFLFIATLLQRWTFEMLPEHAVPADPRLDNFDAGTSYTPKPYLCRVIPRR